MNRISITQFRRAVGMPSATFARKAERRQMIGGIPGQAVVGLLELINKVEDMIDPGVHMEARGFDPEKWVGRWIHLPQPALGGKNPEECMDTQSGRRTLMLLLGSLQSGGYL